MISTTKLNSLPFRKIAPNLVTMLALCAGITSIKYSISEDWAKACFCIFIAGVLDGLDGRVARMLKGSSKFGAELDSLSDFLSFGVAPAILMYQWALFDLPKVGWFCCLLMAMGGALRLARFNTMLDDVEPPAYWSHFFVGVPAPAGAMLAILPVMLSLEFPELTIVRSHFVAGATLIAVALLMVSKIPTISTKKLKIKTYFLLPLMMFIVFFASFIISQPWLVLITLTAVYAMTIPLGVMFFLMEKKQYNS